MKPLIDADILVYEVGSIGLEEDGSPKPFDFLSKILDDKVADICEAVKATEEPTLYLTGKGNFREKVAVTKKYKGNRDNVEAPWHKENLIVYMNNRYDTVTAEGCEADDLMSIKQYTGFMDNVWDTVICTRDKDLRMIPGWHYGWECGKQREFPLTFVDYWGGIEYDPEKNKMTGTGMSFFYAQLIMGDSTDNIPGLPRCGPKAVADHFVDVPPEHMFSVVCEVYQAKGMTPEYLLEQAQLLWMVRELNPDGSLKMWELP